MQTRVFQPSSVLRSILFRTTPALFAASLIVGSAAGDTLLVPADFPTIQAAIDAAVDGDDVLVAAGTYFEAIDLSGKAIALVSESGAASTTIDGGGQALFVVTIASGEGPATRVEGFTISGGVGTTVGSIGTVGGGMRIHGASPTLRGLILADNVGLEGGGISLRNGSGVWIDDCLFVNNLAATGGGLYSYLSSLTLTNVAFLGNQANSNGGGLLALGGSITMNDVTFEGNDTGSLGAASYLGSLNAQITGVRAQDNGTVESVGYNSFTYSPFGGGGLYAASVSGLIRDSIFTGNAAAAGAGIYLASSSSVSVVNTLITDNRAGIWGAGAFMNSASPNLVQCTIANNFPGGVLTSYNSFPTLTNSIVVGNGNAHYTGVEIYGNGATNVSYSLVQGPILVGAEVGPGVIDLDPKLDAAFQPLAGSPVIDAGNNAAVPAGVTVDLAGQPRFVDDPTTADTGVGAAPIVDLGAYEFQPAPLIGAREYQLAPPQKPTRGNR